MSDLPSPSKKATRAISPEPVREPLDPRGSFQREASTEWNTQIINNAMKARQAVQRGQLGMPAATSNRRPLQATQSAPVLSFNSTIPTTTETLQAIYGNRRTNELPQMAEHSYYDQQERSRRSASQRSGQGEGSGIFGGGSFVSNASGYATTETAATDEAMEGDGFDMDEVFGESKIQLPSSAFGPLDDSQSSHGTTRTITQGLKRSFDDGQDGGPVESDDEMATTDVEDEAEDLAPALHAPIGRRIGGRRILSKTTSLPPSLFSGEVQF